MRIISGHEITLETKSIDLPYESLFLCLHTVPGENPILYFAADNSLANKKFPVYLLDVLLPDDFNERSDDSEIMYCGSFYAAEKARVFHVFISTKSL